MDRLGSISAFLQVAELGSFASAGKVMGVSGSAVSKSVSRLEDRLRVRLFNRTTRALSLTDEGREFRDRCAPILADLDDAENVMVERAAAPSGALRVGLPTALGRIKILPILGLLTSKFPDLRIDALLSDDVIDMVDAGLDVTVRIGEPRDSGLMMKRVGSVRYIVCAAPSYLARSSPPSTPDELSQYDCIQRLPHACSPDGAWKFTDLETGASFDRSVSGSLSLDSADAVIEATLAGSGLAQLHDYMAEPYLVSGELVQVLGTYAVEGPPICILYPSPRHLTPKVRAFIDIVTDNFRNRPDRSSDRQHLLEAQSDQGADTSANVAAHHRPRLVASR
ncbi:LysR family transcriptional regulator [Parasphingopyxis algicola]|uniref:LysR family transcriptional regulator n=1 Tax=Parasphingopyxis algicola TaxID=2026624 RepID=UPI0015A4E9E1|nr:LysR family transcriptional regulator [Parasphingopyxis algicola]QLC24857.1 LysR family transcriptional regulator [Parasphingopyxis algicola]